MTGSRSQPGASCHSALALIPACPPYPSHIAESLGWRAEPGLAQCPSRRSPFSSIVDTILHTGILHTRGVCWGAGFASIIPRAHAQVLTSLQVVALPSSTRQVQKDASSGSSPVLAVSNRRPQGSPKLQPRRWPRARRRSQVVGRSPSPTWFPICKTGLKIVLTSQSYCGNERNHHIESL